MIRGVVGAALFAGVLTALVYSTVQAFTVTPLIFETEFYEEQASDHNQVHAELGSAAEQPHGHATASDVWQPENGIERYGVTFLANLVTAVGFALVLVAVFMVRGRSADARTGLQWGLAGFVVFAFAPALGLPPEVPGSAAAPLEARQIWYAFTVAATAIGITLIVFVKPLWLRAMIAPALILAPHLIGAPLPDLAQGTGPVPQELAARYVVWSLATTLFFWILLGTLCGHFFGLLLPGHQRERQAV